MRGVAGARARAERLTRHVNAMLEKKPTVSLPSAREVLRTKIGDCNEHTVLYVAMARAIGIPARIAVGLTFVRGAFYYHAWPEVYLDEGAGRGYWLPVDPDAQSVSGRRDPPAARARRSRSAGGDPAAHRPHEDGGPRSRARARLGSDPRRAASHRHGAAVDPVARARRRRLLVEPRVRRRAASPMIAVYDLVKKYGSFTAVDGVSLDVQPGEIHGFLGPNGAGKTTTIRMIAGLLQPTAGRILVNGHDLATSPEAAKASLGFIPDRPFIYEKLTAGEFLRFHGGLYGMDGDGIDRTRARDARDVRARRAGSTSWSRASRTA